MSFTLLSQLCSIPTAPFAEHRVIAFVRSWARDRKLKCVADRWGNLLISHGPVPRAGQRRLVLAAHMDHPGFVAESQEGRHLRAHFRGGVHADYLVGARVRFFTAEGEVVAAVESTSGDSADRPYPTSAVLTLGPRAVVPAGSPGMFDFAPARLSRTHFHSRVCDDLAGAAAALSALDLLRKDKPRTPFAVLLTRAEEVGFVGALGAVLRPELLRKRDDLLLAIECSAEQPYAKQHDGVILRVGDRTSIFNSSLTAFLHDTALALAKEDPTFKFQRALMPGGTCESTVYDAWGYHAAAVCLALGNYHNMDRTAHHLAAENVSLADYQNMVRLFVRLAHAAHEYEPGHLPLKRRLRERFEASRILLE